MSNLIHLKDRFGNDVYFGDAGEIRVFPLPNVDKTMLKTISDIKLREDDVIISGHPKSGTNWTHHMVSMLKEGTTELPTFFGEDNPLFLEGIKTIDLPTDDKPRVLISHLPFRFLPRDVTKKKVKVIHITRNPKDTFVSFYNHLSHAKLPVGYEGTWSQFFPFMLEQGYWYGDLFDYLKDWQSEIEANPHHPIYHCNYEESMRDTLGQVERLNQFLDTGRSRQLCQEIVKECQFVKMPVNRRFDERVVREVFLWKEDTPISSFFRKGVVGDWKNWFTVAQNEQFDDVYKSKMADYKYTFQYE